MTLVGHVDSGQAAEALIGRDPLYRDAKDIDVPRVRGALSLIFPGAHEGLAGLEPDLIGEHHVADVATDALVDACLDWAGENREQRHHILTVLNRATRAEHGAKASRAEAQLDRMVRTRAALLGGDLIKVGLETPGRLLDLCSALEAQVESLEEPALAAIDASLPPQSLTLMELSLRVAERRAELARKLDAAADATADAPLEVREKILSHLAARVSTLGIRLSNLGRRHRGNPHRYAAWIATETAPFACLHQHYRECHGHGAPRVPKREAMALGPRWRCVGPQPLCRKRPKASDD